MDFELTEDQVAIAHALDQLVQRHAEFPVGSSGYALSSAALERDLEASGFRAIARHQDLGALEAVLVIEAVARIPFATEIAASTLVVPMITEREIPGPVALVRAPLGAPVRFLAQGGTALIDTGPDVRVLDLSDVVVEPVRSFFGYPMARLRKQDTEVAAVLDGVAPARFRQWWRLGLAAEITGAMDAALALTVAYVKQRQQFGQPLGAFQAIQHRLSECAVLVQSARMLVREAALSQSPQSCALAAAFAQDAAARLVYDAHQFHGAIGLTLEYPLHYWTYRLRLLQGELGGPAEQGREAAALAWPMAEEIGDPLADRGL
jgi:Acyl-CoA dehydrogenase, C-terminal domain